MPVDVDLSRLSLKDKREAATPLLCRELKKPDRHDHHGGGRWVYPEEGLLAHPFPGWQHKMNGITNNFDVLSPDLTFRHVRCEDSIHSKCQCGRNACHTDSLVIAVDGACPGNGIDADKSAVGVYFGDFDDEDLDDFNTPNVALPILDHPDYPHTNQRAELHAGLAGLISAKPFVLNGGQWDCDLYNPRHPAHLCRVKLLVIKSDSEYLVNSVVQYLPKWLKNGWKTSRGLPVANRDLWEWIVAEIRHLDELGASVSFWLVPRTDNVEADRLANIGLKRPWDTGLLPRYQPNKWASLGWFYPLVRLGPKGLRDQPSVAFKQVAKYYEKAIEHERRWMK